MKGFIEVTRIDVEPTTRTALVSVAAIKFVEVDKGQTIISLYGFLDKHKDKPWHALGMAVSETYEEVLAKIKEATE